MALSGLLATLVAECAGHPEMEHLSATWIVKIWQNRRLGEHAPGTVLCIQRQDKRVGTVKFVWSRDREGEVSVSAISGLIWGHPPLKT